VFRVLGGSIRGKKLLGPRGLEFRPTMAQVKQFIFTILADRIENARILDLFSGTGSLGIEALSRGAGGITCVDATDAAIRILSRNLKLCGFEAVSRVEKMDVFRFLGRKQEPFDLIFADPPFKNDLRQRIVMGVDQSGLLKPEGLLILEHEIHDSDQGEHRLSLLRQKRFGHCMVSVYAV
jgi:16S rRNA (guanine966-N2)-methyltransferase